MAVKQVEVLIDDLTGEEGVDIEPVYFVHDGQLYRIDLTAENRKRLLDVTTEFAAKGHRLGDISSQFTAVDGADDSRGPEHQEELAPKHKEKVLPGTYDPEHVRAWAKGAGIEVNPRGRIANNVLETFFLLQHDYDKNMDMPPALWERMGAVDAEHLQKLGVSWEEYPAYVEYVNPGARESASSASMLPVAKKTQRARMKKQTLEYPPYDPENVRAWASGAGIEVSPRGRIAKKVLDAFFREHDLDDEFKEPMPKLWEMRGREHADLLKGEGFDWEERSQLRSVEVGY